MNKISTKIRQKQSLIPQQILKSKLLELPVDELEKDLSNEIQKNPVLEEKNIESSSSVSEISDSFSTNDNYEFFMANIPETLNIIDELISQIETENFSKELKEVAKEIIFNLDKNGFLDTELELIADKFDINISEIDEVRKQIMCLSPKGVAAKNLKEYLIFQIGDENKISTEILQNHFDDFISQNIASIEKKLIYGKDEVKAALSQISEKNFSPIFDNDTNSISLYPDAVVKNKNEKWLILINDKFLNRYQISNDYMEAAMSSKSSKEEKSFLKNHISNAQAILDTLNYRSSTLKNVIEEILLVQGEYLLGSIDYLKPLKLEDIAKKLDMDISTISRVIKNKYIDTSIGIVSLKSFFASEIIKSTGKIGSSNELQKAISKIIKEENKKSPLSDKKIAEILLKNDFLIARRTVSKYRKILNIRNAQKRKEL
tara:strand:+ start:3099 stop:4391 length:1293 start_codon:yes stop_codon:yes gene_type:complete